MKYHIIYYPIFVDIHCICCIFHSILRYSKYFVSLNDDMILIYFKKIQKMENNIYKLKYIYRKKF